MRTTIIAAVITAAGVVLVGCAEKNVSYKSDVQPVLTANCNECHAPGKPGFEASGLDTTNYQALMRGGKFGALIKPGDPLTSAFNMVVEGRVHSSIRMPHGREKLADRDVNILNTWVKQGAQNN